MVRFITVFVLVVFVVPITLHAIEYLPGTQNDTGVQMIIDRTADHRYRVHIEVDAGNLPIWLEDEAIPTITRWVALPDHGKFSIRESKIEYNEKTLSTDTYNRLRSIDLPPECITAGTEAQVQGLRLAPVSFNPVRIIDGKIDLVSNADFFIEIDSPPPIDRLSRNVRKAYGDLIINNPLPRRDDNGYGSGCIYVAPPDDRVSELLQDLYQFRRLQGFDVREIVIQDEFNWETLYESIQNANRWSGPIEYICLVGDTGGDFIVPTTLQGTSDYHYSLLSGDDPLPDAAVGRISYNSIGELERIIQKILAYELDPDLENLDWLRRGAVCAGNRISGLSTILVSRWVRDQLLDYGFNSVDTLWFTMNGSVEDFMRRSFDRGVSFINYRGWTGMEDFSPGDAGRLTNDFYPVALLLGCSTGDFDGIGAGYTEALLRAEGGAIGAIGSATLQSRVNYNNALMAGYYDGVLDGGITRLGWTLNRAKLELFAAYGMTRQWVISHAYWTNLMGDPATTIWLGEPREVVIDAPNQAVINFDPVEITVTHEGNPVEEARVGFHKDGEMTAAFYTDGNGVAEIYLDPREVDEGNASIMVSGDRILPTQRNIQLVSADQLMQYRNQWILDGNNEPNNGNNNGIANPMETFTLFVGLQNLGNRNIAAPVDLTLQTNRDEIDILRDDFRIEQDIMAGGFTTGNFLIEAAPDFPHEEPMPMTLVIDAGNRQWQYEISLTGQAPKLEFVSIDPDLNLQAGGNYIFDILLTNAGAVDIDASSGELFSMGDWIDEIVVQFGDYPAIVVNDTAGAGEVFEIEIGIDAPQGAELPFGLEITSEEGYINNVLFTLRLAGGGGGDDDEPAVVGPDEYGYYAIDSQDQDVQIRPNFNWTTLNPEFGGNGINTGIVDRGEDDDNSVAVNLPFTFQYYGQDFDQLTICSNGWAAFGDQSDYIDFRNMPIGSPQGPVAQLCPWWDDLYMPDDEAGVFYQYRPESHTFVVEWSQMRRYVGPAGPGAIESFQLILHDPRWHPTYTGDGDIIFQYGQITHEARVDGNGTPYPTIGVGDPDDEGGLQYGFWNRWADGAAVPAANMAIRFATAADHEYGFVNGTVRSLVNGQPGDPIQGAIVRSSNGGWAESGEDGFYGNLNILAGLPCRLYASAPGFNEISSQEFELEVNQMQGISFLLPHPEVEVNIEQIDDTTDAGQDVENVFQIGNAGNGALSFNIEFDQGEENNLVAGNMQPKISDRDDPNELWDRLVRWNITQIVNDNRILGAAFTEDGFWISGGARGENVNYLYKFNRNGQNVRRTEQPCRGLWGMHDLAWDGENLYGGSRETIYVMDANGRAVRTLESPLIPPRGLAVNPETGDIWIVNDGDPITKLDQNGAVLARFPHNLRPYGLAWHPADKDGCSLYIFSADGETNLAISKMNPETGDFMPVRQLEIEDADRAGGCELSVQWDTRRWAFVSIIQNPEGDRLEIYDAGPNLAWISAEPESGEVAAGGEADVTLTMSADRLDRGAYTATMIINHNSAGEAIAIPIRLVVEPQAAVVDESNPSAYVLHSVYPNPSNGAGVIRFNLPAAGSVDLSIWSCAGREIASIVDGRLKAGEHSYSFIAEDTPSGVYIVRLNTPSGMLSRKFALVK